MEFSFGIKKNNLSLYKYRHFALRQKAFSSYRLVDEPIIELQKIVKVLK